MVKKAKETTPKRKNVRKARIRGAVVKKAKGNTGGALKRLAAAKRSREHNGNNRHVVSNRKVAAIVAAPMESTIKIDEIVKDGVFSDYISRNVGKRALEIIDMLSTDSQMDDKLAVRLDIKVNEVRRMLNLLNGYGIARYDINKDSKGWLTFKWYIDREKLVEFGGKLKTNVEPSYKLPEGVNDFFYCETCYKDQKVILPFDAAFENSFRCECGKSLRQLSRMQVEGIFRERER